MTPPLKIVLKFGTQVVMGEDGHLAEARLAGLMTDVAALFAAGHRVLVVSSGAVGLGRETLGLSGPLSLPQKQACASVGQGRLMAVYERLLAPSGRSPAQVLLTADDLADRQRYLALRETLDTLLELGTVPILNENDTLSTTELRDLPVARAFGDNDKLSSLVAAKLEADLLVILTNVDGVYSDNPAKNPEATRLPVIEDFEQLADLSLDGQSALGRGGMATKLEAARVAAICGVRTWITGGLAERPLAPLVECLPEADWPGTRVLPQSRSRLPGRKRWIALASGYVGVVQINDGARSALEARGASLLPSGIVAVDGEFHARQVVSVQDASGRELGRGLVNYSADDLRRIQGAHTQELAERLGHPPEADEVIHRDHLVLFQDYQPEPLP